MKSDSSSINFQVFTCLRELTLLASGTICNLGNSPSFLTKDETLQRQHPPQDLNPDCDHPQAIQQILHWIGQQHWELKAVAHHVAHGGNLYYKSMAINSELIEQLKSLQSLAPLDQPYNIAAIEIIKNLAPELPQVACFDTAFHAQLSPLVTEYTLPQHFRDMGIRRYGFQGLAYEWLATVLKKDYPNLYSGRVVAAHIGNQVSLCAMLNGKSVDTTMGFTPLDGIPAATQSGSLDPSVLIYMIRDLGLTPNEVERILYTQSGLLGLSGVSQEFQALEESSIADAQFTVDYLCLKISQQIGMMAVALGGIDAIIFSGGIGENSHLVRMKIIQHIMCLKPFTTLVLPANEEKMMAMHALSILGIG